MRTATPLIAGLLLLFPPTSQNPDTPGAIAGRVVISGENTPVARARVMLMPIRRSPPPSGGAPMGPPPQTLTAPNGEYVFDHVAPGEYRVTAQKAGLAEGPGTTQQQTPSVVVAPGQGVRVADIALDRGGAIAGRIVDANGEPLVDARVSAPRPAPIPAAILARGITPPNRPLIPNGHTAQTNDLGEFRIYGLLPGDYLVASTGESSPFLSAPAQATTLSTTYFPGVTDQGAAQPVSVSAGRTTRDIEIRMMSAPAHVVSGIVVDSSGHPLEGAIVSLFSTGAAALGPHPMSRSDARGRFQFGSVTSGTYRVGVAGSSSGPGATMRLPEQIAIAVADAVVSGLQLVLVPRSMGRIS